MIFDGWLALRLLLDSIASYRREGFDVREAPPDSGVDLIASDGERVILVAVKRPSTSQIDGITREDTERLRVLLETSHARLDVLWQPVNRLVSADTVKQRLAEAQQLAGTSTEAAYLLAFAALEASVLRMASTLEDLPGRLSIADLAVRLRDDGFITDDQLTTIDRLSATRNKLMHGAFNDVELVSADVDKVVLLGTNLVSTTSSQAAGLLDQAARALSGTNLDSLSASLDAWIDRAPADATSDVVNAAREALLSIARR